MADSPHHIAVDAWNDALTVEKDSGYLGTCLRAELGQELWWGPCVQKSELGPLVRGTAELSQQALALN